LDATDTSQVITLRSPFNGETIKFIPDSAAMLDAMILAGFVRLDLPKNKVLKQQKETSHGTSETDGH
jgi:hypothetical protein